MNDWFEIYDCIVEITKDAITFQYHPGKFNNAVNHSLTYFFEWLFMSMFKGIPGYELEQFFNLGSQGLQDKLAAEEDSFIEIWIFPPPKLPIGSERVGINKGS
jgi:hypothetical protein